MLADRMRMCSGNNKQWFIKDGIFQLAMETPYLQGASTVVQGTDYYMCSNYSGKEDDPDYDYGQIRLRSTLGFDFDKTELVIEYSVDALTLGGETGVMKVRICDATFEVLSEAITGATTTYEGETIVLDTRYISVYPILSAAKGSNRFLEFYGHMTTKSSSVRRGIKQRFYNVYAR